MKAWLCCDLEKRWNSKEWGYRPATEKIYSAEKIQKVCGGHVYFRLDIILVKGLSKHTLITYFSGMKINPKYVFLHPFFRICHHVLSKISQYDQKHVLFSILHVFAPLNNVRTYIAWSWKTTLITWIFFYEDDIQLQIQVPPPLGVWWTEFVSMELN